GRPGVSQHSRTRWAQRRSSAPQTKRPRRVNAGVSMHMRKRGGDLLSHPVSRAVPSALEGLTSLFGMGRGVTPPPKPPQYERQPNERWEHVRAPQKTGQAARLISTGRLKSLRTLHLPPIDVVISNEPSGGLSHGIPNLEVCFALRGFQRLSRPNIATRQCPWQNNRY